MTATLSPLVKLMSPPQSPKQSQSRKRPRAVLDTVFPRSIDDYLRELETLFERPLKREKLMDCSRKLQQEYKDRLLKSDISMLPSYNHTLPSGDETGDCLALDVGGSTFRIALIRLSGRHAQQSMEIRNSQSFLIDDNIKRLEGQAFFDWMAARIGELLVHWTGLFAADEVLPMGLAWSFPIEQTSSRSGKLLEMGKGFHATLGLEGQDLSAVIMRSCRAQSINVEMRAIVNDSAATLLSRAYLDSSTRMSLIMGTGMNSAVYLPVSTIAADKFGVRPVSWHEAARNVLVNTELSMFGKGTMSTTRWDDVLNAQHEKPDFQPMEYLIAGMYLGEIVRLVLIEGIETAGLFRGHVPDKLSEAYALSTKTVAAFEEDDTPDLLKASAVFMTMHPLRTRPNKADLLFVRAVVRHVSKRAQAYLATAIHALWLLRVQAEQTQPVKSIVACNGTVIEKYPFFRDNCQRYLDELCIASGSPAGTVTLEMAPESSIYGAAVAVSCIED